MRIQGTFNEDAWRSTCDSWYKSQFRYKADIFNIYWFWTSHKMQNTAPWGQKCAPQLLMPWGSHWSPWVKSNSLNYPFISGWRKKIMLQDWPVRIFELCPQCHLFSNLITLFECIHQMNWLKKYGLQFSTWIFFGKRGINLIICYWQG